MRRSINLSVDRHTLKTLLGNDGSSLVHVFVTRELSMTSLIMALNMGFKCFHIVSNENEVMFSKI